MDMRTGLRLPLTLCFSTHIHLHIMTALFCFSGTGVEEEAKRIYAMLSHQSAWSYRQLLSCESLLRGRSQNCKVRAYQQYPCTFSMQHTFKPVHRFHNNLCFCCRISSHTQPCYLEGWLCLKDTACKFGIVRVKNIKGTVRKPHLNSLIVVRGCVLRKCQHVNFSCRTRLAQYFLLLKVFYTGGVLTQAD